MAGDPLSSYATMINRQITDTILRSSGAASMATCERIQTLWSGYGQIFKATLENIANGPEKLPVVIKHVKWPSSRHHPVGWTSDLSHQRKVRSYEVECAFYMAYATACSHHCRVPRLVAIDTHEDELLIILEDLDASGFPLRKYRLSSGEIEATLRWLAWFHATFLNASPEKLWPVGTYWHLETRPDELAAMNDDALRRAASRIDAVLNEATFKTFVHGDAKVANFCFAGKGQGVAAVDFQYVGGGCGMKDVAYFLGSCLHEDECERLEEQLLTTYFSFLHEAVGALSVDVNFGALKTEWRELYHIAWVDFHRFIKGWTHENWHRNDYSERLKRDVLSKIEKGIM